ncbi:hypothetical protein LC593_16365 [Nostoc sp. CHAB 5844]|nr:hypothetical protein [Nostoc sp. CHAB 5844]
MAYNKIEELPQDIQEKLPQYAVCINYKPRFAFAYFEKLLICSLVKLTIGIEELEQKF